MNEQKEHCVFTTGSCAAAAAKAAAFMLISGKKMERIRIETPAGIPFEVPLENIEMAEGRAFCAVRKGSGEDPDVTAGCLVCALAEPFVDGKEDVIIAGGEGVGVITRPGLDQPVGNAAINSVPRSMISKEVREVMSFLDYHVPVRITISVPYGQLLAEKTFNPRLGIEGGISIIGTSGIVEPMSTKALLQTIRLELRQRKECGEKIAVTAPGNYGMRFLKDHYGYDLDHAVKCSNYIGKTIDMAKEEGFSRLLLVGHAGKLVKVSGGIMNTHSQEADCRMELIAAAAIRCHTPASAILKILDCASTEEACGILMRERKLNECFAYITDRISYHLNKRAGENMDVQCIVYSIEHGILGKTVQAEKYLREVMG